MEIGFIKLGRDC